MEKTRFSEMNLSPDIERAVSLMGFEYATPIQAQAIPVIRTGADVIAKSQTGTGKTVAFAIPAIENIDTETPAIQALILCPTRELAMQGYEEITKLARFDGKIRPVAIYGGASITKQCISLRQANIVIGTPGRVMDHMRRKTIKLQGLKMLVLDEADEMLNMGFREDIETILSSAPEERQTILFSATMPPAILKITNQFQRSPTLIEIDKSQVTLTNIEQKYIDVPHNSKKDALALLLQYYEPNRTIIFTGTKKMADELTEFLHEKHISADSIHSDIKQNQRTAVMQAFKSGKTSVLIATDIAARGIDVNDIDYVINYDLPDNKEYYVHRIGRTGRAGKSGCSITICGGRQEVAAIRQIAIRTRSEIAELPLPTAKNVQEKGAKTAVSKLEQQLQGNISSVYADVLGSLVEKGYSPEQVAAAALSLLYKDMGRPVIPVSVTRRETADSAFSGNAKNNRNEKRFPEQDAAKRQQDQNFGVVVFNIGRTSRVTVNHLVGTILDRTDLDKRDLGHIEIAEDESFVEIAPDRVDSVLQEMADCRIIGKKVKATVLSAPKKNNSPASGKANRNSYCRGKRPAGGKYNHAR
ncbi:MAG: DEAD/DEAH box helicase [Oscillospiraceae bacterium]|jgi:ATP-dependent RNA helicase DeaD|nr:DEAD/DEAH box helicase [Oscillospiraceae bacterium]